MKPSKYKRKKKFRYVTDLGQSWHDLTGLPFVFALWVLRQDVPINQATEFENCLINAFSQGRNFLDIIAKERATPFMNENTIKKYINHFTYQIGAHQKIGMEEFELRLSRLPQWEPEKIP